MPINSIAVTNRDDGSAWSNGRKLARAIDGTLWAIYSYMNWVSGRSEIRASYSNDSGLTWTEEVVAAGAVINYMYPALAVDSNGDVHVAYQDDTNDFILYRQRTGGAWAAEVVIENAIWANNPSIAIDSGDDAHIVYEAVHPIHNRWNIRYRAYVAGVLQAAEWITAILPAAFAQHYPQLAIDTADVVHVVWEGSGWGANPLVYSIQYRQRTGVGWQAQEEVCNLPASQWRPSLAIDSAGDIHVVWFPGGGGVSYRARIAAAWGAQENPVVGSQLFDLSITLDRNDVIYVTASCTAGAVDDCRYITRTAGAWGALTKFTPDIVDDYYQVSMFAVHPRSGGQSSCVLPADFAVLFSSDTIDEVRFYSMAAIPTPPAPTAITINKAYALSREEL